MSAMTGCNAEMAISIDDSSTESSRVRKSISRKRKTDDSGASAMHNDKRAHVASSPPDPTIPDFLGTPVASNNHTIGYEAILRPEPQLPPAANTNKLVLLNNADTGSGALRPIHVPMAAQQRHTGNNDNEMDFLSERVRVSMSPYRKKDQFKPDNSVLNDGVPKVLNTEDMARPTAENHGNNQDIVACSPPPVTTRDCHPIETVPLPTNADARSFDDKLPTDQGLHRVLRHLQLLLPIFLLFTVTVSFPVHSIHKGHGNDHVSSGPSSSTPFKWFAGGSLWRKRHNSKTGAATVTGASTEREKPLTLRNIMSDRSTGFHLAMAPAFFGFYGYFGALAAWMDAVDNSTLTSSSLPLKSVAGASAGAMAAVLLAAGIAPVHAAEFCANMTVDKFADFPGFGAVFRGNKFERLMNEFLSSSTSDKRTLTMEDALVPLAVTAFDLQTMSGKIVTSGSMARAARASATFPGLFQPVGWNDENEDCLFIDGGIADPFGMVGLTKTMPTQDQGNEVSALVRERVVNLRVGSFRQATPPGPSTLPGSPDIFSIAIEGLPLPGPWAMKNGPLAFDAARLAMTSVMDVPLTLIDEKPGQRAVGDGSHYLLVVNAK